MPFKTRRQKIAAEARRFSFVETQIKFVPEQKLTVGEKGRSDFVIKKNAADLDYVKGDLIKIFLIASAVVIVQITLALTLA